MQRPLLSILSIAAPVFNLLEFIFSFSLSFLMSLNYILINVAFIFMELSISKEIAEKGFLINFEI